MNAIAQPLPRPRPLPAFERAVRPEWLSPLWHQVAYNLAAQRAHALLEVTTEEREERLRDAAEDAGQVLRAAALTLEYRRRRPNLLRWWRVPRGERRALIHFLEGTVEPASAVLLGGILLELPQPQELPAERRIATRGELIAVTAEVTAEMWPALAPQALVDYVIARAERISYRAHYNLACYYATAARRHAAGSPEDNLKTALGHLETSLRRAEPERGASIVRWARRDPSLAELRGAEGTKADFVYIAGRYERPQPRR